MSIPRKDLGEGRDHIIAYETCYQYDIDFTAVYPKDKPWTWPRRPNKTWPKIECQNGWVYDRSEYKDSLVTEVSNLIQSLLKTYNGEYKTIKVTRGNID